MMDIIFQAKSCDGGSLWLYQYPEMITSWNLLLIHPPFEVWRQVLNLGKFPAMDRKCWHPHSHFGALSCWKIFGSSAIYCWIVGRTSSWRTFWYHFVLFVAIYFFFNKNVNEPRWQTTPNMDGLWMLHCRHEPEQLLVFSISFEDISFLDFLNSWKGA